MEFKILNASVSAEKEQWLSDLSQLPPERRDVYFQPEYIHAYVDAEETEACCAVCKSGSSILMYPFLKSSIAPEEASPGKRSRFDIQSAYGYGGPVVNTAGEDPQFLKEAWSMFSDWCESERIITEFVRFHPLIDNVRWIPQEMRAFEDRKTIPMMLESYEHDLRNTSYYRSHRGMLNKADRMGFSFHVMPAASELDWFVPLYLKTQDYLEGTGEARVEMDYFKSLTDGLGEGAWLGVVKQSNEITGAVLVLEGPAYLHSHLMGYRRDIKTAGMTNLLYHGIALEGASRGKKILHMGGGTSSSEGDALFRFKKSLSPARASFWLGTRCHDHFSYEELGKTWEAQHGPRPKNYFQFYRLKTQP